MRQKYLKDLVKTLDVVKWWGDLDVEITGIASDSRKVAAGFCFVAIRGFKEDGHRYTGDALDKGAVAVLTEAAPTDRELHLATAWIQIKNDRLALSKISAAFYDNPSELLNVIGVTGTNGKTTVATLVGAILEKNAKTAVIGTLGMKGGAAGELSVDTSLTTPESSEILGYMASAVEQGYEHVVMEVSSVALKLYRVEDVLFDQAIFTSFSGDHLDFHRTMEEYFSAKLALFKKLSPENWAIVNIDDPVAFKIIEVLECKYLTYGFAAEADVRPIKSKLTVKGIQATILTPKGRLEIKSSLVGRVNLQNILAAVSSAVIADVPLPIIQDAIREFPAVKGRLDFAYRGDFSVLIDYAHTDNALESLLKSLKEITAGNVILVFGAGGSRDKTKRPRMGKVASELADFVIVTSDNPRMEDPDAIIRDIVGGFTPGFHRFHIEVDRETAIMNAISRAEAGDIVAIAGKGHENYQIFADRTIDFDDFEVVTRCLEMKTEQGKE